MTKNMLKLNTDRTMYLLFGTPPQLSKVNRPTSAQSLRSFRIIPHQEGSYWRSEQKVISTSQKFLTLDAVKTEIQALVCTQIDINNSLYYGLPNTQLQSLQRIQNAAARIIFKKTKYEHVTPVLHELHWLPVSYRIRFELLVLTLNVYMEMRPVAFPISFKPISPFGLRSNKMPYLLQEARSKLVSGGDRSRVICSNFRMEQVTV